MNIDNFVPGTYLSVTPCKSFPLAERLDNEEFVKKILSNGAIFRGARSNDIMARSVIILTGDKNREGEDQPLLSPVLLKNIMQPARGSIEVYLMLQPIINATAIQQYITGSSSSSVNDVRTMGVFDRNRMNTFYKIRLVFKILYQLYSARLMFDRSTTESFVKNTPVDGTVKIILNRKNLDHGLNPDPFCNVYDKIIIRACSTPKEDKLRFVDDESILQQRDNYYKVYKELIDFFMFALESKYFNVESTFPFQMLCYDDFLDEIISLAKSYMSSEIVDLFDLCARNNITDEIIKNGYKGFKDVVVLGKGKEVNELIEEMIVGSIKRFLASNLGEFNGLYVDSPNT
jgi:hypothetical protein